MGWSMFNEEFTRTGKGLLTIFFIGLAHQLLKIQLVTSSIKIPWLPEIQINNLSGITWTFMAFLSYAIFRYTLHNLDGLSQVRVYAIFLAAKFLKPARFFPKIQSAGQNLVIDSEFISSGNVSGCPFAARFTFLPDGRSCQGYVADYYLSCNGLSKVTIGLIIDRSLYEQMQPDLAKMGIEDRFKETNPQIGGYNFYQLSLEGWRKLYVIVFSVPLFVVALFSEKQRFDVAIPVVSCIALLFYLMGKTISATFGA